MTSTKNEVVPLSRDIIYIDFKTLKNFIRDVFIGLKVNNQTIPATITTPLKDISSTFKY